jgi:hypothetical protein
MVPKVSASSGRKKTAELTLPSTRERRSVTEGSRAYSGRMFCTSACRVPLMAERIAWG